ncbi:hypothetical protein DT076_15245 [Desertihabitans brevis]|uniref:Uncharacterized protein n=1 Tax=Desertihabitans brevis TaxID=2268447 RepID=A0A367YRR6_9ACTN|nr:hypothetical protein [Desertihabitans brevis]RCK68583.1 hypothetical protein DT076_15245 [Desertihabitans brevis]
MRRWLRWTLHPGRRVRAAGRRGRPGLERRGEPPQQHRHRGAVRAGLPPEDDDCPTCGDLLIRRTDPGGGVDVEATVDSPTTAVTAGSLTEDVRWVRLIDLQRLHTSGLVTPAGDRRGPAFSGWPPIGGPDVPRGASPSASGA